MEVKITENHIDEVLSAVKSAKARALEIIGLKAEKYAKALCRTGTSESTGKKGYRGGTLKNSITHVVSEDTVSIGSNVEYAPYVELGTGPNFTPPPEWETFDAPRGRGVGHAYVKPRPYLRPAIEEHRGEYEQVMKSELGG